MIKTRLPWVESLSEQPYKVPWFCINICSKACKMINALHPTSCFNLTSDMCIMCSGFSLLPNILNPKQECWTHILKHWQCRGNHTEVYRQ